MTEMRLDAYLAWKPEELVAWCGYYPHWGASVALLLPDRDPILFVPGGEPEDIVPEDLTVIESPWGASAHPWRDLAKVVAEHLPKTAKRPTRVGYDRRFGRLAPPRNAAEGPPTDLIAVDALEALPGVARIDASEAASTL